MSTRTTRAAVELELGVDRVAGRAGAVGDDHPLGAEEGVDQRGLADVRAADDRDARRRSPGPPGSVAAAGLAGSASSTIARSSRSPVPRPCAAETANGSPRPERVELGCDRARPRGGRPCWRRRPPGHRRGGGCRRPPRRPGASPARRVDDEHDRVGLAIAGPRLPLDGAGERLVGVEVDAPGVDQRERHAVPFAVDGLAVAGDARARSGRPPRGRPRDG